MAGREAAIATIVGIIALVVGLAVGSQLAARTVTTTRTIVSTSVTTVPTTITSTIVTTKTLTVPTTVTSTVVTTKTATKTMIKTVTKTVTITAAKPPAKPISPGWPRVIIDALGRNVTIPRPPERVASLSPAITETLCVLHALDRLVAADKYSLSTPCVKQYIKKTNRTIVNLGGYWWTTLNLEKLVEAKPDLVIAEVGAHAKLLNKFEELHLPVIYVHGGSAKSITQVYQDILEIGYALGLENRAYRWVAAMRANITAVEKRLANATVRPVLIILWWSPQGVWVPGGDTFIADMVRVAKGKLVTGRLSGWQMISLEEMASMASKYASKGLVILYTGMSGATANQTLSTLKKMASTTVIKQMLDEGATLCGLYGEAPNYVLRPGPFIVKGVYLLAKLLHPKAMGGLPKGVVCLGR